MVTGTIKVSFEVDVLKEFDNDSDLRKAIEAEINDLMDCGFENQHDLGVPSVAAVYITSIGVGHCEID